MSETPRAQTKVNEYRIRFRKYSDVHTRVSIFRTPE